MKTIKILLFVCLIAAANLVAAFNTEKAAAPDPEDKPLDVLVFYPNTLERPTDIRGDHLPLIVISHGTGGSNEGHADTAQALADAGFVVAAVMHTGDNYRDQSYVSQGKHLSGRPRHISRTIDYMLKSWRGHDHIDSERIGIFGHSAGAFTALVVGGANPDLSRRKEYCHEHLEDWGCQYLRKHNAPDFIETNWQSDARIKAAVLAAPAIGNSFTKANLANVTMPIQLWHAEKDIVVTDSALIVRDNLPAKPEFHSIKDAGHFSFLSPCDWKMHAIIGVLSWFGTEKICDDPDGFDREAFHAMFNADVVRFFRERLTTH